ncbi:MAG: putative 26S proteasome regulatory subunit [Thelocarpon impressellum]|nr:MAG: putative 26S proteasome regulatory subunit [Thelocarpon impressellum]
MESIHAPTVPSGPTSGPAGANGVKEGLSLSELIAQKDRVESELKALSAVLESHGVNMNTSLTTFDGYPRDDLDVAQIRTTRARIIPLRNDYKALMDRIEVGLHELHASLPPPASQTEPTNAHNHAALSVRTAPRATDVTEIPFARVNSVVPDSPAAEAGLRAGDGIRRFDSVNWTNHEKLTKVAETVQRNAGRPIMVKIVRKDLATGSDEEVDIHLTPRKDWGGRGMLGCHLLPA